MRRKDREVSTDEFYEQVFNAAEEIFIAMNDGLYPYGVIMNFARSGNLVYLHAAKEGKKLDCLRKDGHVAFCLGCDIRIDRERNSTYYKSVYGRGIASLVEDSDEKRHALDLISERYKSRCPVPASEEMAARVAIVKIAIEELSGKTCKPAAQDTLEAGTK